ncbi:hypothetical protein LCGC14_0598980 [marine sediment metagenome]|uniref:Uncharacterized protein n=1 Tax=marine sediment metagenome TaxID=412755 RepID=A0A0F9RBD9_9ZZZZ
MFKVLSPEEIKEAKVGHVAVLVRGKPQVWEADRFIAQAALKDAIRQFKMLLDGIENPCKELPRGWFGSDATTAVNHYAKREGWAEAIQTIKQAVEEGKE